MDAQILVVDDDNIAIEVLHEFLAGAGYKSYMASSAKEALELMKQKKIDVIVTDISMPEINGLELADMVRKNYDTDVILMTGHTDKYSYGDAISKGASDIIFKPVRLDELLLRVKRVIKERRLTRERDEILKKLQKLAITDALTTLYNLRHFYAQLELETNRAFRYKHPLSLLLLDIDHFKWYNDNFGHIEGDKVLIRLAELINSCLRNMDSAYRYGGEEFTIILPETKGDEAKAVAERIRTIVKSEHFYAEENGKSLNITVSIGVTQYSPKEELLKFVQRADKAMYISKQKGRDRTSCIFV